MVMKSMQELGQAPRRRSRGPDWGGMSHAAGGSRLLPPGWRPSSLVTGVRTDVPCG